MSRYTLIFLFGLLFFEVSEAVITKSGQPATPEIPDRLILKAKDNDTQVQLVTFQGKNRFLGEANKTATFTARWGNVTAESGKKGKTQDGNAAVLAPIGGENVKKMDNYKLVVGDNPIQGYSPTNLSFGQAEVTVTLERNEEIP